RHPLLSKLQVSLNSVRRARECFVGQVTQILHSGNQLFNSPSSDEVLGEMIPQIGFIVRQICPTREGVGIQQVCVQRRQCVTYCRLQVAADHIVQANRARSQVEVEQQGVPIQRLA